MGGDAVDAVGVARIPRTGTAVVYNWDHIAGAAPIAVCVRVVMP